MTMKRIDGMHLVLSLNLDICIIYCYSKDLLMYARRHAQRNTLTYRFAHVHVDMHTLTHTCTTLHTHSLSLSLSRPHTR